MLLEVEKETMLNKDHSIARFAHTGLVSLYGQPQVNWQLTTPQTSGHRLSSQRRRIPVQTGYSSLSCNVTRVSNFSSTGYITILQGPFNIRCATGSCRTGFKLSTTKSDLIFPLPAKDNTSEPANNIP